MLGAPPLGQPAGLIRFPGPTPESAYRVTPMPRAVSPKDRPRPAWYDGGAVLSGRLLDEVGMVAPPLEADDLVIVHLVADVASRPSRSGRPLPQPCTHTST